MATKIQHKSGAIEFIKDADEKKADKDIAALKGKDKKPAQLTDTEMKALVYKLSKLANLI